MYHQFKTITFIIDINVNLLKQMYAGIKKM